MGMQALRLFLPIWLLHCILANMHRIVHLTSEDSHDRHSLAHGLRAIVSGTSTAVCGRLLSQRPADNRGGITSACQWRQIHESRPWWSWTSEQRSPRWPPSMASQPPSSSSAAAGVALPPSSAHIVAPFIKHDHTHRSLLFTKVYKGDLDKHRIACSLHCDPRNKLQMQQTTKVVSLVPLTGAESLSHLRLISVHQTKSLKSGCQ